MLVYTRLSAGYTKNGVPRRIVVVNECRQAGAHLVKVIRYYDAAVKVPEGCLFGGEFYVLPAEIRSHVKHAKDLGVLEYEG